jgi:aspartate aminotransferase
MISKMLSQRVSSINPSPTLSISAKVRKMRSEGVDVIGFGAGEPDFDTPLNIKEKAKEAIEQGFTKYTPTPGTKELRCAIVNKLKRDNNLTYSEDQILVSCGAKHSIFNALLTLCQEGDEVILPAPYWVSYPEMIKITQARPVIVRTKPENNFKITPVQLKKVITSRSKLLFLNSPSNPTGTVYRKNELESIADILVKNKIYCISDEIYEKIIYDNLPHISVASLSSEIKKLTLTINGVSKAYAMTGWRIGYCAAEKQIIEVMSRLQDHSTSAASSISQKAAEEALTGPQKSLKNILKEFSARRDYIFKRINTIPGLSCLKPQGAFYVFVDISQIKDKSCGCRFIQDSFSLAEILLDEARVAVVPGAVFGDDNFIRLSFATSMENIIEGLNRIEEFMGDLRQN